MRTATLTAGAVLALALLAVAAFEMVSEASAQNGCEPSYPYVCIPPPPPDIDCGNIVYRDFTVLEPDPHDFDGNNDGIGCETASFGPGQEEVVPTEEEEEATATPAPAPGIVDAGFGPGPGGGGGVEMVLAVLAGAGVALTVAAAATASRRSTAVAYERPIEPSSGEFVPRMRPLGNRRD